jgi:hypothetical protein
VTILDNTYHPSYPTYPHPVLLPSITTPRYHPPEVSFRYDDDRGVLTETGIMGQINHEVRRIVEAQHTERERQLRDAVIHELRRAGYIVQKQTSISELYDQMVDLAELPENIQPGTE